MASVVERFAGTGDKRRRRLYVVFWVTDRTTGKRRKVWELQRGAGKTEANKRASAVEVALDKSGGLWPAEEPQAKPITFAEYRDGWLADRAHKVSERVVENDRAAFRSTYRDSTRCRSRRSVGRT